MTTDLSLYKTAFYHAPIATLIVSPEGIIRQANIAASNLLAYTSDELETLAFPTFCMQPGHMLTNLFNTRDEVEVFCDDVLLSTKGGTAIRVNISSVLIKDAEGEIFNFCTLRPIANPQELANSTPSVQSNLFKVDEVALVNTSQDLIWSVSLDYHLLLANKAFIDYYFLNVGVSIKSGDSVMSDAMRPDQILFWEDCYNRAVTGPYTKELVLKANDKREETWMEVNFNPIYSNDQIVGIGCYSRDVTTHKLSEEKIKKNEASLAEAQSLAKIGSWETEVENFNLKWSDETYRIFELSREDFEGNYQVFLHLIYSEDRAKVDAALMGSLINSGVYHIEYRVRTASGLLKIVEQRWQVVKDIHGKPVRMHGTCQDITERRNFEEALHRSEEKYRIMFDSSPVPKWIYDLQTFHIQDVNLAAINQYGYSKEEFLSMNLEQLRPPQEVAKLKSTQGSILSREGLINFGLFTHLRKDGTTMQVEVSGSKIIYNSQECMMVVCNDMTQREIALEILLDREAKLRRAHEIAKLGHWELDIETKALFWSREIFKIWEIDASILPDFGYFVSSIHPDDKEEFLLAQKEVLVGRAVLDIEHRITLKDGSVKWVHEMGELKYDATNNPTFLSGTVQDVTPRKLLELSLAESNKRYQLVSKATSDAIWDWDLRTNTIYWGDGIRYIFGYEEKITKGPGDVWKTNIHPDDYERVEASVQKFIRSTDINKLNWEEEYRFKKTDGKYAFVLDRGFLIKNEHGVSIRMVGAMQDISARKEIEAEVHQSRERFELLGKASNDAVWEWNDLTQQGWANLTHQAIFGLTSNDLIPMRREWISRLHEDDRQIVLESYQKAADAKMAMWQGEYRMRADNKGWISVYDRTYLEYDDQGNVVRKIGSMMDITRRKKEEQHLKLLESVIINANDSVIITEVVMNGDRNSSKIIYVNEAFTKMTGYEVDEIMEKSPGMLQGEGSDFEEIRRLNNALANFKHCETTLVNYKKNGQAFWINFSVSPVADEKGRYTHWIAVQRDVTAQKLAEIHLAQLNENLQKHVRALAVSNAELEQFAFVASHDLQEPLRMVTGFVTQLEKKYGDVIDDRGKTYIAFAVDGARRMRQIILDLLEYSKVGRADQAPEHIDLNDLIEDIQILFRTQLKQIQAKIHIDKLPVLLGHVAPMRQVFQNLISNALKYMRPGVAPEVYITVQDMDTEWQFAIKDNGIGIEQEYFEKIFIIFQRLHQKTEFSGTGLGLAITKKIIDNMGGRIWVSSVEGEGSTFYFTVPHS